MALVRMTSVFSRNSRSWLRMHRHSDLVAVDINFQSSELAVHSKRYGHVCLDDVQSNSGWEPGEVRTSWNPSHLKHLPYRPALQRYFIASPITV